jgi:hypothetical protein
VNAELNDLDPYGPLSLSEIYEMMDENDPDEAIGMSLIDHCLSLVCIDAEESGNFLLISFMVLLWD